MKYLFYLCKVNLKYKLKKIRNYENKNFNNWNVILINDNV